MDAVETVIRVLEDSPLFNAGKGAVLNDEGNAELDASIMSGKDLSAGGVASLKHIKNPITLARFVMEHSPHVLMFGDGAEKFAEQYRQSGLNFPTSEQIRDKMNEVFQAKFAPESEEEKKMFTDAQRRRQLRLLLAGKLKIEDEQELKAILFH